MKKIHDHDVQALKEKETGPFIQNPCFDLDLDKYDTGKWRTSKPQRQYNQNTAEILKERFDLGDRSSLIDFFWEVGILNPDETVWVEGTALEPYNKRDLQKFMILKNNATLKGVFNGKNLDEGGQEDLYVAWFRLKGCSREGAEFLLAEGVKPWEIHFE